MADPAGSETAQPPPQEESTPVVAPAVSSSGLRNRREGGGGGGGGGDGAATTTETTTTTTTTEPPPTDAGGGGGGASSLTVDTPPPPRTDIEAPKVGSSGAVMSAPASSSSVPKSSAASKKDDGFAFSIQRSKTLNPIYQKLIEFCSMYPRSIHYIWLAILLLLIAAIILIPLIGEMGLGSSETVRTMAGEAGQVLVANMQPHALYKGNLFPFGKVTLRFDDDKRFLALLRMDGLEDSCVDCHFAVVDGTSCTDPALLSNNHLYDPRIPHGQDQSPFQAAAVYTSVNGVTSSSVTMFTGMDANDYRGHTVTVYDSVGNPLACGVLEHQPSSSVVQKLYADLTALPSYPGNPLVVETTTTTTPLAPNHLLNGTVLLQFYADHTFMMSFEMHGLPSKCFACPLRIHEGRRCSQDTGRVFWNLDLVPGDPYNVRNGVFYHSTYYGFSNHAFILFNGYTFDQTKKRTIVVYDHNNQPIGCGEFATHRHQHVPDMTLAQG